MQQRFILAISLTIVFFLLFSSSMPIHAQSQIFVGPGTRHSFFETESFSCSGICRISWHASAYGSSPSYFVEIFKAGDPPQWETSFYGLYGETYFYSVGTYYFRVHARSGIRSWHILVEPLNFEQLEPTTHFTDGKYGNHKFNTEPFLCSGHCTITWTTTYDPSRLYGPANFTVHIKKLGMQDPVHSLRGYCNAPYECSDMKGTIALHEEGMFYFMVVETRIEEWEILVEDRSTVPEGDIHVLFTGFLSGLLARIVIRRSHQGLGKVRKEYECGLAEKL